MLPKPKGSWASLSLTSSFADGATETHKGAEFFSWLYKEFRAEYMGQRLLIYLY